MNKLIYIIISTIFASGCAVGPDFKAPEINTPQKYINQQVPNRDFGTEVAPQFDNWWQVFGDTTLNSLVEKAIRNNKDIEVAINNLKIAQLEAKNAGKNLLPSLGIEANGGVKYSNSTKFTQQYGVSPTIAWEIDVFGELRRTREAERAAYFATDWGSRAIYLEVVSSVISNYFALLSSKSLYLLSKKTFEVREKMLDLIGQMYKLGAVSKIDYNSALSLTLSAEVATNQYLSDINQYERILNALLGDNPTTVDVGESKLSRVKKPNSLPKLLPVWIIENRPDVIEAYYTLMESNAEIGVAIAKRYPKLSLSVNGGILYSILSNGTYNTMPFVFNGGFQLLAPLFNWGNNKRDVDIAKLSNSNDYLTLEQTILNAYKEVETILGNINELEKNSNELYMLVKTNEDSANMVNALYLGGGATYINLLDAQRELFSSQQLIVSSKVDLLTNYVNLYKAIGASW